MPYTRLHQFVVGDEAIPPSDVDEVKVDEARVRSDEADARVLLGLAVDHEARSLRNVASSETIHQKQIPRTPLLVHDQKAQKVL